MPYNQVMHKFKFGKLHSGSQNGPKVSNRKQAIAIMLSEKRKADNGDEEYQPTNIGPSFSMKKRMMKGMK